MDWSLGLACCSADGSAGLLTLGVSPPMSHTPCSRRGSSRGSLESRVTPATKCLANTLPQSQRQVQGFHKVNTSPCHSALMAVFRSLSLDVRRPGTESNTHNLRAKEHFTVGQVSRARTNHGLFLGLQASLPAYAQPHPRPSPITPWTLFQH